MKIMFKKPRASLTTTTSSKRNARPEGQNEQGRANNGCVNVCPHKNDDPLPPSITNITKNQVLSPKGTVNVHKNAEHTCDNQLKLKYRNQNARYNVKVQCCADDCESDSSSTASGIVELYSDTLAREREHYNKLKININMTKKLSKRVKTNTSSSTTIDDGSALLQSKRIPRSSSKVSPLTQTQRLRENSTTQISKHYRKEGHAKLLHSVTRQSVSRPLPVTTVPSSIPKSKSSGDIYDDHSTTQLICHSKSFNDLELVNMKSPVKIFLHRGSIETMDKNLSSDPSSHYDSSHLSVNNSSAVRDGLNRNEQSFMNKIITFTCTNEGKEVDSMAYDFSICIPKGAVKKRKSVELQVGVCLHGPFTVPKGYSPVSPIVMVTSQTHFKLKKPIQIFLSHCIARVSGYTAFFHANKLVNNKYLFQQTDSDTYHFQTFDNLGKITTTELGFYCIMAKDNTNPKQSINYSLVPIIPKNIDSKSWTVHYCVIYQLKALMKEIEEQFGPNWKVLPPIKFTLGTKVGTQKQEKIKVNFYRTIPECGWLLSLESDSKILTNDINLWSAKWMRECNTEAHPPRFTIRVNGEHALASSTTQVWFTGPGMQQDLITELELPLRSSNLQSPQSPYQESLSSFSSISIQLSPVNGSILYNDITEYDHLPSLEELDQTHIPLTYYNGNIDIPTDEELQVVAHEVRRAVARDWIRLQIPLEIPDYIMMDILHQRNTQQQVFRLLKEWRLHAQDGSRKKLAHCLWSTDTRLHRTAAILLNNYS